MRKALVLFDLDGVLLDSRANMERAWEAVTAELSVTTPFEAYFAEIGRPFGDIMLRLGMSDVATQAEQIFRRASGETLSQTPFYPGVADMLSALAAGSLKLGVVTSKDSARTTLVLDRLPVRFATVRTPGAGLRGKPAPDSLLMAMAECNVDPDETIFVGDMDTDAAAAARANIDYAHVAWGYGDPPARCAFTAADCPDLLAFLTR